jgi:hypothetical protein
VGRLLLGEFFGFVGMPSSFRASVDRVSHPCAIVERHVTGSCRKLCFRGSTASERRKLENRSRTEGGGEHMREDRIVTVVRGHPSTLRYE